MKDVQIESSSWNLQVERNTEIMISYIIYLPTWKNTSIYII